ncbi:hypothetical protein ACFLZ5_03835 [Thermodesulfobacteriota bacterium]
MFKILKSKKYCWMMTFFPATMVCFVAFSAMAGPYRDSAHGNSNFGVNRSVIDGKYTEFATGNCEHCHETHASLQGTEPAPANGPAPHTLFAESFNTSRTQKPYLETDNFCFYCHSETSGQQVKNQDYSTTFGGGTTGDGPQSIMTAFNQSSYHNLYDIWNFLNTDQAYGPWFALRGNPCSSCHNSHLAKRNWDIGMPGFPLNSTITLPGTSNTLWGETETMANYFYYEAPYAVDISREPAGIGEEAGGNTPDYVSFCTSCHNPNKTIWSTTLNRELKKINWDITGLNQEKHGALGRDGTNNFREPYLTAGNTKNNFILSCLDCHEAHGSENIMLIRRRVNGENLEGIVDSTDTMSYFCKRCHTDDLAAAAGTGEANRWEYIHHGMADAPYAQPVNCIDCHTSSSGGEPIPCGGCHGHGTVANGRTTF